MIEFDASIQDGDGPVHPRRGSVALRLPDGSFHPEHLLIGDTPVSEKLVAIRWGLKRASIGCGQPAQGDEARSRFAIGFAVPLGRGRSTSAASMSLVAARLSVICQRASAYMRLTRRVDLESVQVCTQTLAGVLTD